MTIAEKLTQISENEQKVYEAGYEKGKAEGGGNDAFWDVYQDRGNNKMSHYMFAGNGWNDETFKPRYDIKFRYGCTYTFALSLMTDIVASLQAQRVTLDTKEASNLTYLCYSMNSRSFPVLDTTGVTGYTYTSMRGIFYEAEQLEYIDKIKTNETIFYNDWFHGCDKLKDVTFEGVIGNDIDFQYSTLLSKASIKNIIGCLSDTASDETKTLTLSKTAVESAFGDTDEQAEISISGKQSDGFYIVTFGSREDENSLLKFADPMNISFHGAFLADSDLYEVDILRSGVYRLNMNEEVTATAQNGEKMDLSLSSLLSDGGPLKIKRTDGGDLSSGDVTAYLIGELNYEWFDLIATKPNWDIILI